jgi:hypothetical protein
MHADRVWAARWELCAAELFAEHAAGRFSSKNCKMNAQQWYAPRALAGRLLAAPASPSGAEDFRAAVALLALRAAERLTARDSCPVCERSERPHDLNALVWEVRRSASDPLSASALLLDRAVSDFARFLRRACALPDAVHILDSALFDPLPAAPTDLNEEGE